MQEIYDTVVTFTRKDIEKAKNTLKGTETDLEKVEAILNTREDEVHRRVVDCADYCINLGLDQLPICEIGESILDFVLKNYEETLTKSEMYFVTIEDYEMCSRIVDLKSRIESLEDIQ